MPAPGLTFVCGPARITCERTGRVSTVVHAHDPALSYVSGMEVAELQVDGATLAAGHPEVVADVDELEFGYSYPGRLRVVVRHSFTAGWGVRVVVTSLADEPQSVERAVLSLEPAAGCLGWALVLGATATYAVLPASAVGPVLGGLLRRGSLQAVTPSGLHLSPFELAPASRYVVQLQWNWYRTPRAFGTELSREAPSALTVAVGEPVQVLLDEDVAVLAPRGVETIQSANALELVSEISGSYPVELRSSRGTTEFDLEWVDPPEELLAAVVDPLPGTITAAGVVKLPGVAEALVVQHALATQQLGDPDEAAEALDLFTARLTGSASPAPLEALYLTREFNRLGDDDLLLEAREIIEARLSDDQPVPGLGIAATQLCLALLVSGRSVDRVLTRLSRLAGEVTGSGVDVQDVPAQAAALEILAVTDAAREASTIRPPRSDLTARAAALGLHLGAGLVGRRVAPLPLTQSSHLITVLQLLPDGVSGSLTTLWGCSAHTLARRAGTELLARLKGVPIGEPHAWLVLGLGAR